MIQSWAGKASFGQFKLGPQGLVDILGQGFPLKKDTSDQAVGSVTFYAAF